MSYGCVTASTKLSTIYFQVPWAHEKSELQIVCFILDSATYEYYVASAGDLTLYAEGDDDGSGARYSYACPFITSVTAETGWAVYVWRKTTATEDDVAYGGGTIPIEEIVAKFEEHSDKGEETTLEASRAIRVPETDSNAFFPPKSVRADLVAGFDSDGNPTVGKNNIAELAEIEENLEEAVSACTTYAAAAKTSATSAEASATAAAESATSAAAYATNASTYATNAATSAGNAATSASSAKSYATSAASSASSAEEDAEETADALKEATELLNGARLSAENLSAKIEEALSSNLAFVDVPTATNLVAGVVKLSTADVISATNGVGVVGFNDDEQLVVPIATDVSLGVVSVGEGLSIDTSGVVGINSASTEEIGGVLLSSSATLTANDGDAYDKNEDYIDQDYNFYGGAVGLTEEGALAVRTAQLQRYGVVRLGSQFQPAYTAPYVVGVGASSNSATYGQLMFNLKQDGCLVYQAIQGSGSSGSNTVYVMSVLSPSESSDGYGVVKVKGDSSASPTDTVVAYSAFSDYSESTNSKLSDIQAVVTTLENASLFSLFHVSTTVGGTQYSVFYCTSDAQTLSIYVSVVCQINELYLEKAEIAVSTSDESQDVSWFSVDSSFNDIYSDGVFTFTTETNSGAAARSATVRISYFTQYAEFTVKQLGLGVSIDDIDISSAGGEIGISAAD